jgi:hypothetical protein
MQIKDLAKTLSHEERAAVSGGGNSAVVGGLEQLSGTSQFGIGNSSTNVAINAPSVVQVDDPVQNYTKTIDQSLEAIGSLGVFQK